MHQRTISPLSWRRETDCPYWASGSPVHALRVALNPALSAHSRYFGDLLAQKDAEYFSIVPLLGIDLPGSADLYWFSVGHGDTAAEMIWEPATKEEAP